MAPIVKEAERSEVIAAALAWFDAGQFQAELARRVQL